MEEIIEFFGDILMGAFRWIGSFFGGIIQGLAGFIFSCIDVFLQNGDNSLANNDDGKMIVENVLSPLYDFSKEYLVPIALSIMLLIVIWRLLVTMFGEMAANGEDPIVLFARTIIFGFAIAMSMTIIDTVGNKIVFPIVCDMASVDVSLNEKAADGLNKGKAGTIKDINETFGTNLTEEDMNTPSTKIDDGGSDGEKGAILVAGTLSGALLSFMTGSQGFFVFFLAILVYILIWGVMVLVMAWKCLGICYKLIQRMVSFLFVLYMAPLAFACGPSKSTQRVFEEWCKMVGSYALTMILTTGLLRVTQEIVYQSFVFAGKENINFIGSAMVFGIAIAFIDIIKQLEQYVDKLGFTAIGFQNRSFAGTMIAQATTRAISNALFGGKMSGKREAGAAGARKSIGSAMGRFDSRKSAAKDILHPGKTSKIGPAKALDEMFGNKGKGISSGYGLNVGEVGKNARNLVKDTNGNIIKDNNGVAHALDKGAKPDKNGMITALDGNKIKDNGERFSDVSTMPKTFNTAGRDPLGTYVGASKATGIGLKRNEDGTGRYYAGKMGNQNIAVDRNSLANDGTFYDENGNILNPGISTGNMFAETKDGNIVNVGDASATYDCTGKASATKDVSYITSDNGTHILDTVNDKVYEGHLYSNNLEPNAKILNSSRIESFRQINEETRSDGSLMGTLQQKLDDGSTCFRNYTIVPNNEVHRGFIDDVLRKKPTDPCIGYTPDGKYFMVAGEVTKGRFL